MKKLCIAAFVICTVLCIPPLRSSAESIEEDEDYCSTVADGQLHNGDRFRGSVRTLAGGKLDGAWYHQTPGGDLYHINKLDWVVTPISSRHSSLSPAGSNFSKFGGKGTWNSIEGYSFRVLARQHSARNNSDYYSISIFGPDGKVFYASSGNIVRGDISHKGPHCSSLD